MAIALFGLYLFVFAFWLYRWGSKSLSNLSKYLVLVGFLLRVAVGVFMAYYTENLEGNDSWKLFNASKEEVNCLIHHPGSFISDGILDNNGYSGNPFTSFFFRNSNNFYFNDLKDNIIVKFNAILNVFSGGNYYVNILIANFLVMWCLLALVKVFRYNLKPDSQWTIIGTFLLYLPLILWTSNIQKDMLCLMLLSVFLYCYSFLGDRYGYKRLLFWMYMFFSVLVLVLIKNYMAIILVGCTVMVRVANPNSTHFTKRFFIAFGLVFVFFMISSFFPNSINFPLLLARKQNGFYDIAGAQPIPSIPLTGNILSYIQNLPNAIFNCFFFPISKNLFVERIGWIGFAIFFLFLALTVLAIKYPRKSGLWSNAFFLMMFSFCLLNYLLIGESVAYYGALQRYRAIPEAIFCILILQLIDFKKINDLYISKKNI
ncbi:MAG: hypothetical protein DI598_00285 [Pseudopedobacter saltans]|uniref:Glycosyltransferase RgtA/B/C/D-like domain-containing protein n=1 Tax=Pseudopedobacter saltans TaxID=151895 RepID=A0A2W5H430_9SPHI|nr:MAG: hypothetical protein DI598_00285 [Pseudopedobacter saltans]